jgi:16S rRNA (cytosine1402-N4)-methyltransferase
MIYRHTSVLKDETIELLRIIPEGVYADGTLGGGGHAEAICRTLSENGIFIGIDRDTEALDASKTRLEGTACKKIYLHSNYADVKKALGVENIDGIDGGLLDLGVSSYQLDNKERGFSYMQDSPLDMRMNGDSEEGPDAESIVNSYSEAELTKIIRTYGEERWASRIAKFIVSRRKEGRITTTGQLTETIKAAIPASARREGPHPAKRTFQAIRIEVNDELGSLRRGISDWIDLLKSGGRLAIITFHSLEDRIVKEAFSERENPCTCPPGLPVCACGKVGDAIRVNKKPVIATEEEMIGNPRARSAKLRVLEKKDKK